MRQNRGWLIGIGCVVVAVLVLCVGGIVAMFAFQGQMSNFISLYSPTLAAQQPQDNSSFSSSSSTGLPTAAGPAATPEYKLGDMQGFIQKNNGKPCSTEAELTCVTLSMPLDHTDSSNTKTIDVTFGIRPATGDRYGMFVQAFPGGPGGAGIGSASGRVDKFDKGILEHYDIVFFDQRGVGLSSPVSCPKSLESFYSDNLNEVNTAGQEGYDTPKEQQAAVDFAKTFVTNCVKETGVDPTQLKLYDTKQVIEDLEAFRQAVGDEKFYLYGVSYGTEVAQMYAAAHADHLAGMVLDGTVDMTLDGPTQDKNQIKAFAKALSATLDACNQDTDCHADMGGDDAQKVYDDMAATLSKTPQNFDFPLPDGTTAKRIWTLEKLEATATFSMYSGASRMVFMRSLAAAHRGDFTEMARLFYALQNYDPKTERYIGDRDFSYTDFFMVNCADIQYYTGSADDRVKALIQDSAGSYGTQPRLDEGLYSDLPCIFWPDSPTTSTVQPPLKAPGVPTLVLNATLDPATPFEGGQDVAAHLDQGYHIYVDGGEHGSYLNDENCPDQYVTDLLVNHKVPDQKEIKCTWSNPVMWAYQAPNDIEVSQITPDNIAQFMLNTDFEILFTPDFLFDSGNRGTVETACPNGGKFSFSLDKATKIENFVFTNCAYTKGFAMTGTGDFNTDSGDRSLDVDVSGTKTGHLTFKLVISPQSISVTGNYGGQDINFSH